MWGAFKDDLYSGRVRDHIIEYGWGMADGVTLNGTKVVRSKLGIKNPDEKSVSYKTGDYASLVMGNMKSVLKIGKGIRIESAQQVCHDCGSEIKSRMATLARKEIGTGLVDIVWGGNKI